MARRTADVNRNAKNETDFTRVKMILVAGFFALLWLALWGRAAELQLKEGPELKELASRQHLAAEFEHGERGRILDRNGNQLATSVESKSVYLQPLQLEDRAAAERTLVRVLGLPARAMCEKLASKRNFVWVKRQINDREAVELQAAKIPGVFMSSEYHRMYPNGFLAGQVLGFVGLDGVGLEGIERAYEQTLKGGQARFVVQRDASGRRLYLDAQGREVDIRGHDVMLTIDAQIQSAAETALADAVHKFEAKRGIAVVADVKSGELLALADYPFFNPNTYRSSTAAARKVTAVTDTYEPGSTMKPFMMAAALEEHVVKPGDLVDCENGRWKLGRNVIRDHQPHRWLPLSRVLSYSSNIGSAKIGLDLGAQHYSNYLQKLGFGEKTGLELPGESRGLIRPANEWTKFDLAAASFGQGIGVTAVQLTRGFLCLANEGVRKPLTLVKRTAAVEDSGDAADAEESTAAAQTPDGDEPSRETRVFSRETTAEVLAMMRDVVEDDGTAERVRIPGVPMAGKTGTAQKASKDGGYGEGRLASFAAIVPADAPEMVVVVMIDEPQTSVYGSSVAAPVVRKIVLNTLAYYGRLPELDDETKTAALPAHEEGISSVVARASDPPATQLRGSLVPDVDGMPLRRAMELLIQKGVVPVVKGSGVTVSDQQPKAGEPWPKGDDDVFVLWVS